MDRNAQRLGAMDVSESWWVGDDRIRCKSLAVLSVSLVAGFPASIENLRQSGMRVDCASLKVLVTDLFDHLPLSGNIAIEKRGHSW